MTTTRIRLGAGAAATVLPLLALVVARIGWGAEAPPVIPQHWSGTQPDRFGNTTAYFWIALAVCCVAAVVAGLVVARDRSDAALWLPITALTTWTVSSAWILGVALTVRAGSPAAATMGAWIVIPLLGLAWGAAVFAIAPKATRARLSGPTPTLSPPLAPSERASWTAYARGPWAAALTLVMTATAIGSLLMGVWWLAPLFLILAVASGVFASVGVHVDRAGLTLSSWNVRWRRIPLDSIESAQVATIRPAEWGGWGYRFSPRGTAVVVRGGEGILLTCRDGRQFAVTVPAAEQGAALLNSLLAVRAAS
ncbi:MULTISPECIES: hypothetical protein [Rhodococcus]|uniref:DUF1648 domain-containing protein n=1 Tax=Rhodococcus oxybenzonivorans TaxID=1990687 RepID=A0AAE4V0U1_9NOCA|nr:MULTISPECIES: hypothetical protein [Rhodococcus]MDV7242751.1 hypothetical protein [Rhodococcus oxybenzonivorans]MDV7265638.1 hypothetical protein [Rhodococcus oxybenzonivorans]MDV7276184.1 hypothetical protein [Rhodococcus oxybenzonivorans]MDV7332239.1 hypothetical protein [Rhodococcus oxybenzonivorans]MDV7344444.1 hypothetical protein [Rhodococcus oxybenzonivorans]